jgi:hypothetical protein
MTTGSISSMTGSFHPMMRASCSGEADSPSSLFAISSCVVPREIDEFVIASPGAVALLVDSFSEAALDIPVPLLLGAQQPLPQAMIDAEPQLWSR